MTMYYRYSENITNPNEWEWNTKGTYTVDGTQASGGIFTFLMIEFREGDDYCSICGGPCEGKHPEVCPRCHENPCVCQTEPCPDCQDTPCSCDPIVCTECGGEGCPLCDKDPVCRECNTDPCSCDGDYVAIRTRFLEVIDFLPNATQILADGFVDFMTNELYRMARYYYEDLVDSAHNANGRTCNTCSQNEERRYRVLCEFLQNDVEISTAHAKLIAVSDAISEVPIKLVIDYSFDGNRVTFTISFEGETEEVEFNFTPDGAFPAGEYLMDWERYDENSNWQQQKWVFETDGSFTAYSRYAENLENPAEWEWDAKGNFEFTGTQADGGTFTIFITEEREWEPDNPYCPICGGPCQGEHPEVCPDCHTTPCICGDDVCTNCGGEGCPLCDGVVVCPDCEHTPCTCHVVICTNCDDAGCEICTPFVCPICEETPCTCEPDENLIQMLHDFIVTLQTEGNRLMNEVATLRVDSIVKDAAITQLEGTISAFEGTISTLQGEITGLRADTAANAATIASLEKEIEDLKKDIADLEAELANCTCNDPSSIAQSSNAFSTLKLSQNPVTTNELRVENSEWRAGESIRIYNMNGALVAIYTTTGAITTLNISQLSGGTYLLRVGGNTVKFVRL
jgi:rubrerythrin